MDLPRILVTGGTGFLGSEVVKRLIETNKFEVTAIDINPPSLGTEISSDVRYVRANILSPAELHKVFAEARPSIVVHTAGLVPAGHARYHQKGKEAVFQVNVEGTRNVIEASKECGAKGLIFTSSVTVLVDELGKDFVNVNEEWPTGRASLVYGQSKTAAENLVLGANSPDFSTCSLRLAPIFGPNDSIIPQLHSLIPTSSFILGSGDNLTDFIYLSNAADAHVLAVQNLLNSATAADQAIFVTNGEPITARDFCIAVWKEFGHVPSRAIRIPVGVAWWMGLSAEAFSWLTGKDVGFSRGLISDGVVERYMSIAKARRILRYSPSVSLPDAIRISCAKLESRKRPKNEEIL
ncbi:C-3 sterol dehydrogenase/C-4 decarboxylase-like protein [Lophiotrema nucula]|uniref:C-3 sterol dehydrogenase/C-4 decarboxylase-like protein n=1 Tax=Lophiotrema nucula TaxID=690887 RepID=A0A6A5YPL8_9PLEO|nr:C-3 sterol dehydrogenase/C-4 decarboxylase-like protein [Lophiotrema nucula]